MKEKIKKIAFCITCMNRLNHLQQTLEKNIQDNYLLGDIEFVLLDYNSQDGLEEWTYHNMMQYIKSGILVYYKTVAPKYYFRSHSRNMVFRLANAEILCNLDADNFLGKGFASFIIDEFRTNENIFYSSNATGGDIVGRVCVKKEDFMAINGYDEEIQGYGYEDTDLFTRLEKQGLEQKRFNNPDFYHCIKHSNEERIKDEFMAKNTEKAYISYVNPYTSRILLLYSDFTFVQYTLIDNGYLNLYTDFIETGNQTLNEKKQIILGNDIQRGSWCIENDNITLTQHHYTADFNREASMFQFHYQTYYIVTNSDFLTEIILVLTYAINFHYVRQINEKHINECGFGKGTVCKNFNLHQAIHLL